MIIEDIDIEIQKTEQSRVNDLNLDNLKFGRTFSDHMFVCTYDNGRWNKPVIRPYGPITMSPASAGLHYGQSIFEGMKAYKNSDGKVSLFRPLENLRRLNASAERMCMPQLDEQLFIEGLKRLLEVDNAWIPSKEGYSLYIRPVMFADEEFLGVKPSDQYKFIIITSPSAAYYTEPVKVKIEKKYTRAIEGGVGYAKAAGNYAAALYPAKLAAENGYHQIIWTDGKSHDYIEEAGTMNIMFQIGDKLVTPSLDTQTILPGITRDSTIKIAHDWGIDVEERNISIQEIETAYDNGLLKDAFGMGTAATIAPIASIGLEHKEMLLPEVGQREWSPKIKQYLDDIRLQNVDDKFGWIVKV